MPSTTLAESGLGSRTRVKRLDLLLYGPFGVGKSIIAHRLPRTRTLDFDDGLQSVEWAIRAGIIKDRRLDDIVHATILEDYGKGGHVNTAQALDQASDQIDEWLAEEHISDEAWDKPYEKRWDTLIVDSGSSLSDYCIWKGLDENARLELSHSKGKTRPGGITVMRKQDWGSASSLFQKFINGTRVIGKNVVLICHEYQHTTEDGALIAIEPLLIGQLRQKLAKDFDEVWYVTVEGTRNKPEYKIQTSPDPKHRLRSRLGCLDPVEDADFDKIRKKVAKFYDILEDMLWTTKREGEEVEEPKEVTRASKVVRQAEKRAKRSKG